MAIEPLCVTCSGGLGDAGDVKQRECHSGQARQDFLTPTFKQRRKAFSPNEIKQINNDTPRLRAILRSDGLTWRAGNNFPTPRRNPQACHRLKHC